MQVKCKQPTVINQNFAIIPLSHGMTTIIDPDDFEEIAKHKWKAVRSAHCWYAVRDVDISNVNILFLNCSVNDIVIGTLLVVCILPALGIPQLHKIIIHA